jgi:hypothetical protein
LPATFGAVSTGLDALIHTTDLLAICRACLADFGADLAKTMLKMRAAKLKISRRLADLSAVHDETEVFCNNVLAAGLEAVVHGGLQTDLMAVATSLYTGLHGVFSVGWLIHAVLLRLKNRRGHRRITHLDPASARDWGRFKSLEIP